MSLSSKPDRVDGTKAPTEGLVKIETNPDISVLDQVKIQAQVLLPVLKVLRKELGEERGTRLLINALREWSRDLYRQIGAAMPGSPMEKWTTLNAQMMPRIGNDIDIQLLKQEPNAFDFDVTRCRYAEFFREVGEPELGAVLLCEGDDHLAEVGSPDVELTRTQTIMKGASYCDFRYRMKTGGSAPDGG